MKRFLIPLLLAFTLFGCSADTPWNPSFPLTLAEAREEWRLMSEDPRPFERPVVVLSGIYDPGLVGPAVIRNLREVSAPGAEMLSVSFLLTPDFDACRARAIEHVDHVWPTEDPDATIEVDVVAISMGGLVARYAARPTPDAPRRLRIRRLFTIATPHQGAKLATLPTLDARVVSMRAGSSFLAALNDEPRDEDPEIFPYTRLDDAIVGPDRTAPPGRAAWWVANMPFAFSHLSASHDPRIMADIARRLRGELPYTSEPAVSTPDGTPDGTPHGTPAAP